VSVLKGSVISILPAPPKSSSKIYTNPYHHAEDRGLVLEVYSSAAGQSAPLWTLGSRPQVAPGLLSSENTNEFKAT
jgi:hypothetical protein